MTTSTYTAPLTLASRMIGRLDEEGMLKRGTDVDDLRRRVIDHIRALIDTGMLFQYPSDHIAKTVLDMADIREPNVEESDPPDRFELWVEDEVFDVDVEGGLVDDDIVVWSFPTQEGQCNGVVTDTRRKSSRDEWDITIKFDGGMSITLPESEWSTFVTMI